ncbi:MAG: SpoIIE family protein phosphatase [Bryobacteraceae bacterium]
MSPGTGQRRLIECGVSARPLASEPASGDLHLIQPFGRGVLMAVVDGIGHGSEAAAAARIAIEVLREYAEERIPALARRCHERLKGSRGAVIGLASFDGIENTMTWAGIGNVEGWLLRARGETNHTREVLLNRGGVVGYTMPPLHLVSRPVAQGDLLIAATDGIRLDLSVNFAAGDTPASIADDICTNYSTGADDALVLVARYLGWGE